MRHEGRQCTSLTHRASALTRSLSLASALRYIAATMKRRAWAIVLTLVSAGCGTGTQTPRSATDAQLFGPASMRLHPFFTQVRDWDGDNKPDGIEAVVELQDQFGEPTKATGRVLFELYAYSPYKPDPRGSRLANPWEGRLLSVDDQRTRWSVTSRAYTFRLSWDQVRAENDYVLTAQFDLAGGSRFFNRLVLEGIKPMKPDRPGVTVIPATTAATSQASPATQPDNKPPARINEP